MSRAGRGEKWRRAYQIEETRMKTNTIALARPRDRVRVAIHNILVAIDFSDGSKAALRYAARLAAAFDAAVTVVNVIEVNCGLLEYGANDFPVLDEQSRENRRRSLQSFAAECDGDSSWRYIARLGKPAEEIAEAAREAGADIIFIATRGLTDVQHAVIGSTAEKVVRTAPCPVWVVPAKGAL
jgi:nucleotide-binding universal stress UspA family protein